MIHYNVLIYLFFKILNQVKLLILENKFKLKGLKIIALKILAEQDEQ